MPIPLISNNGNQPLTVTGTYCKLGVQSILLQGEAVQILDPLEFFVSWGGGAAGGLVQIVLTDLVGVNRGIHYIHGAPNYFAFGVIPGPFIGAAIFFQKAANNINYAQLVASTKT